MPGAAPCRASSSAPPPTACPPVSRCSPPGGLGPGAAQHLPGAQRLGLPPPGRLQRRLQRRPELLLCLLPDINSLAAVAAIGAATTLGFSVLATVGSALQRERGTRQQGRQGIGAWDRALVNQHCPWAPHPAPGRQAGVSYAVPGSPAGRVFGAFSALGGVYLLFGLTVLLDIQVGGGAVCMLVCSLLLKCVPTCRPAAALPACLPQSTLQPVGLPPSAVPPMVRTTVAGYCALLCLFLAVTVSGYWAFGTAVQVRVWGPALHMTPWRRGCSPAEQSPVLCRWACRRRSCWTR